MSRLRLSGNESAGRHRSDSKRRCRRQKDAPSARNALRSYLKASNPNLFAPPPQPEMLPTDEAALMEPMVRESQLQRRGKDKREDILHWYESRFMFRS
ncbi:MAG: hypothetical protein H5T66_00240 [Chloroflexi bacterium]|nr:hypothetical protein [Chloroflexota bacterium]